MNNFPNPEERGTGGIPLLPFCGLIWLIIIVLMEIFVRAPK